MQPNDKLQEAENGIYYLWQKRLAQGDSLRPLSADRIGEAEAACMVFLALDDPPLSAA